jgi:hypothetical protein
MFVERQLIEYIADMRNDMVDFESTMQLYQDLSDHLESLMNNTSENEIVFNQIHLPFFKMKYFFKCLYFSKLKYDVQFGYIFKRLKEDIDLILNFHEKFNELRK